MKRLLLIALVAHFLLPTFVTLAQEKPAEVQTGDELEKKDQEPKPPPSEPTAPYDDRLLRLAEILGSVHYLRALCGANEGNKWRESMNSLIISEKPGPKRKARLVSRFNRGYRAFDQIYGNCTPSAVLAAERYRMEGAKISAQILSRYGR